MAPSMTKNNYKLTPNKWSSVAKKVPEGTINDVVQDLWNKNLENNTDDTVLDKEYHVILRNGAYQGGRNVHFFGTLKPV